MSDFYTYRREVVNQRRRRSAAILLAIALVLLCAAAGFFWFHSGPEEEQPPAAATAEPTATPEPTSGPQADPQRILPAVDRAAWDTATPVEATIDTEYRNTDHRMVALPASGTVDTSYFGTVTFIGDSIASGLGIYATGIPNAKYCCYVSASVNSFVNNAAMKNAVTQAQETPLEAIEATQPDAVYILVGTNNLVNPTGEEGFIAYYERLIDMLRERLHPDVVYYIQAIPGVQEDVVQTKPGLDNARIQTVNDMLANLALRKGCYFVNTREVLANQDGSMVDDYGANDGIHFNAAGYAAWNEYLKTHTAWSRRTVYAGENPLKIFGAS